MRRILCHFSCGAASAVATKLAINKYGKDRVEVLNIHIKEEHPDNQRFLKDCEAWFGVPITTVQNDKYNGSIYEVFKQGYLKGRYGAPCTTQLKRKVRAKFQREDDIHIFGYTVDELQRSIDFEERNEQLDVDWVLIEANLAKQDCLAIIQDAGIKIPFMYELGYKNNNCIGCVKGGMGYWNNIRKDFPDVFVRMSMVERNIGHSILKEPVGSAPIFLDELDPNRGDMRNELDIECSFFCEMAKEDLI
ncbi:hypothetical protein [Psychrobacter sp. MES7-P7E]|uniref:hypothetical protein n=1 Tax=Psychrobacter sp. MES7-P7E TaxID=2058322 RepID=UPI000C7E9D28|nr:hypothetical protein [Psychrobacter sp. MES7-P7E]PLT21124.1 hypothetical protein CXF62_11520 [Psychrobacter sp. MES7-P7E]